MNRIVHISLKVDDVKRTGDFYQEVFGFQDSETRFVYVVRDDDAVRVPVEYGAAAIGEIEIRNGLRPGDEVVLSDMREYNDAPSVLIAN